MRCWSFYPVWLLPERGGKLLKSLVAVVAGLAVVLLCASAVEGVKKGNLALTLFASLTAVVVFVTSLLTLRG